MINVETVGPRIRMLLPSLTDSERQIAESLLNMGEKISEVKISEIAERFSVSEAMLVKLSKKLQFSGFRELKKALAEYASLPVSELHEELDPNDTHEVVVTKVFRTAIQALEETLHILDIDKFSLAVRYLVNAKQCDFYGVGGSAAIANDACHKLLRIGYRANAYSDSHMMLMSASLLSNDDVVVAISHSGRTKAIVDALSQARKSGARTILISNYANSPASELADVTLWCTSQGSPILGENSAARIVQLNIIDALFVCLAQARHEESMKNLTKTIHAVRDNKL
jgi:DNA-binding MurR/RpiR family transcriptional regulator